MMAAGAFNQVQSSLRWFVDNFSTIADWRATLLRVADFRRARDEVRCDRAGCGAEAEIRLMMEIIARRASGIDGRCVAGSGGSARLSAFFWEGAEPASLLARDRSHQERDPPTIWSRWAARASG